MRFYRTARLHLIDRHRMQFSVIIFLCQNVTFGSVRHPQQFTKDEDLLNFVVESFVFVSARITVEKVPIFLGQWLWNRKNNVTVVDVSSGPKEQVVGPLGMQIDIARDPRKRTYLSSRYSVQSYLMRTHFRQAENRLQLVNDALISSGRAVALQYDRMRLVIYCD